jgi:[ribosomal protein S18]-alanine N-acetyltransferase
MMDDVPEKPRVQLRPMRMEDVEQVYAIDVLSFSLPWTERSYRFELTENPAAGLWVAEVLEQGNQPRLAGVIVTWFIIDEVHVANIAVHPDYRRLGIGRKLLAHALLHSAYKGANTAMLEVRRGNLGAQALYEQFGFKTVGVRNHYYVDNNEDALLMNLEPIDVETIQGLEKM